MLNCIFCLITWHWPVAESLGRYNVTTEQQRDSHHNKNEPECPEAKYLTSKSFLLINSRSSHKYKRNGTLRERNESNRKRERLNLKELNKLTLQLLLTRGFSESGRVSNTSLLGNGVFCLRIIFYRAKPLRRMNRCMVWKIGSRARLPAVWGPANETIRDA